MNWFRKLSQSFFVGLFLVAFSSVSRADLIDLVPNPHSPIPDAQTSVSGTFHSPSDAPNDAKIDLTTVGVGRRKKRFAGVLLKVYIAQLLVSEAPFWNPAPAQALSSLEKMHAAAMVLTTERPINSSDLVDSFQAGLDANQILSDSDIEALLQLLSAAGDIDAGSTVMFCFERIDENTEVLSYRDPQGGIHELKCKPSLRKALFSIWLGTPSDEQLGELKNALLGGNHES